MNLQRFTLLLAACSSLMIAQPQTATPAAPGAPATPPPGVEAALRERVRPFYQSYVDGKFRKGYDVAADDSKDAFLNLPHAHYDGFQIQKIVFSDDYTTAKVTTEIQTTFRFYGVAAPEKSNAETNWKLVDGQWYWYIPDASGSQYTMAQRVMMSRFHMTPPGGAAAPAAVSSAPPAASTGAPRVPPSIPPGLMPGMPPSGMPQGIPGMPQGMPGMPQGTPGMTGGSTALPPGFPQGGPSAPPAPASPAEILKQIRSQVTLDKPNVVFHPDQPGTAVVLVKNAMKDPIRINMSGGHHPGLAVSLDKTEIGAGESAAVSIAWKPIGGGAKAQPPQPATYGIVVMPSGAVLRISVTFQ